jgi:hypothetical protein
MMGKKAIKEVAEQQCGVFNVVVVWRPNDPSPKTVFIAKSGVWPKKHNGLDILMSALEKAQQVIREALTVEYANETDKVEAAKRPMLN